MLRYTTLSVLGYISGRSARARLVGSFQSSLDSDRNADSYSSVLDCLRNPMDNTQTRPTADERVTKSESHFLPFSQSLQEIMVWRSCVLSTPPILLPGKRRRLVHVVFCLN